MKYLFPLLLCLLTLDVYSQNIEYVKNKLVKNLTSETSQYSWKIKETACEIELSYIDTFFINTSMNPLYNRNGIYNKLDTIYIKIRLEENWTQKKIDSIKIIQKAILDPLIERFITYYDSLKWRYVRASKEMFLYQPVFYLILWDGITEDERYQLKHLIRLPDKTIGSIGLFVDSTIRCYAMIEPKEVNIKVDNAYKSFSKSLGVPLYLCENIYK